MPSLDTTPAPAALEIAATTAVVDVLVPVHNEEHVLAASIERLHGYLTEHLVYPFRITVADNASTDATLEVAHGLRQRLPGVEIATLTEKGRGRALRQVWLASDAPVLAYMDVDLSTDLAAFMPLVAPLLSGHSDVAIGSRITHGANVIRGTKRGVISRCYNHVLRVGLGHGSPTHSAGSRRSGATSRTSCCRSSRTTPGSSTPSCSCSPSAAVCASTRCRSTGTTTPTAAWTSSAPRPTTCGACCGCGAPSFRSGALPVASIKEQLGRGTVVLDGPHGPVVQVARTGSPLGGQVMRFAAVGVASTVVHLGLFAAFVAGGTGRQVANLVALLMATVLNTTANRAWTFGVRGRSRLLVQHGQALAVFALTWGTTAAALAVLGATSDGASAAAATVVVAGANVVATVARFVAMRRWIFRAPARIAA
ncbi:glycosyltransferase [Luteipulveratus halotolerans]|uniref:glycosyltransferase n=1 Tax=Luteipulveratus halotolerans TaxID=1631356 RepID=UPI001E5AD17C|nr:glycosyltransferase [Luteipulveratus halotolerans]